MESNLLSNSLKSSIPCNIPVVVTSKEILQILQEYNPEYIQIKSAIYDFTRLISTVRFSSYPFGKRKMDIVSSNLINLAMDQCAYVHIGMMIKYNDIELDFIKNGIKNKLNFEEYNMISRDEFLLVVLNAKYRKPIPVSKEIEISSRLVNQKRTNRYRYLLKFQMESIGLFIIEASVIYPSSIHLIKG